MHVVYCTSIDRNAQTRLLRLVDLLYKLSLQLSCAAVDKISTDIARRAVIQFEKVGNKQMTLKVSRGTAFMRETTFSGQKKQNLISSNVAVQSCLVN